MYNLLIVDDEKAIVDGIEEFLLSSDLNLTEISKAYSAKEALTIFNQTLYDIVITDIRMPEMDGISMAKIIRISWKHVKIIFLTGFNDFKYVQEALRIGSIDYLLKPVRDSELLLAVRNAIQDLNLETKKLLSSHPLPGSVEAYWIGKQQLYFEKVLLGDLNFSVEKRTNDFKSNGIRFSPVKPIYSIAVFYGKPGNSLTVDLHLEILHTLQQLFSKPLQTIGVLWYDNTSIFLVQEKIKTELKRLVELQSYFCEHHQALFSIYPYEPVPWENWPAEMESMMACAKEIETKYCFLGGVSQALEKKENSSAFVVKAVKTYIINHLSGDLSLLVLSNKFHINPSYLSRLFSQIEGIPLSSYITGKRIDQAQKMLIDGNYKVNNIAQCCGFKNPNYFSKVFFKRTGCLPNEYKLKNCKDR